MSEAVDYLLRMYRALVAGRPVDPDAAAWWVAAVDDAVANKTPLERAHNLPWGWRSMVRKQNAITAFETVAETHSKSETARTRRADLLKYHASRYEIDRSSGVIPSGYEQATRTIPIVFTIVSEPVANRFVESLAHPGGNLTGFTNLEPAVGAKWLEILKEIGPHIARIAIIFNPETTPSAVPFSRSAETAAQKLAVGAVMTAIHEPGDIEPVMSTLGREPGGGLIFPPDAFTAFHRKMIIELAARYRLPAIYPFRYFAADGELVSYGTNVVDQFRQAAVYVDQILRGTKPGDLPVQQPNKFQLVINLKTAKALGLTIPPTLLATADEVIE